MLKLATKWACFIALILELYCFFWDSASCPALTCQAVSREENLDLNLLPNCHPSQTSEATHVISRFFYGAEVYCILTEDIYKTEEEERKKSVENIGEKID